MSYVFQFSCYGWLTVQSIRSLVVISANIFHAFLSIASLSYRYVFVVNFIVGR